jgi:hypothetical protein
MEPLGFKTTAVRNGVKQLLDFYLAGQNKSYRTEGKPCITTRH